MTIIAWPVARQPSACTFGIQKSTQVFRSPFNGTPQVVDFNAERWLISLLLPPSYNAVGQSTPGAVEALLMRLAGGVDWVQCWHFGREQPAGTARGAPTLSSGASRGDATLAVTGFTASGTLKAGDMLGAGNQLFMVRDDITLNGSGAGTVNLVNRVRATIASASVVTWDKPTAYFAMLSTSFGATHVPVVVESVGVDLIEVW